MAEEKKSGSSLVTKRDFRIILGTVQCTVGGITKYCVISLNSAWFVVFHCRLQWAGAVPRRGQFFGQARLILRLHQQ